MSAQPINITLTVHYVGYVITSLVHFYLQKWHKQNPGNIKTLRRFSSVQFVWKFSKTQLHCPVAIASVENVWNVYQRHGIMGRMAKAAHCAEHFSKMSTAMLVSW